MPPLSWGDFFVGVSVVFTGIGAVWYLGRKMGRWETYMEISTGRLNSLETKIDTANAGLAEVRTTVAGLIERRLHVRGA